MTLSVRVPSLVASNSPAGWRDSASVAVTGGHIGGRVGQDWAGGWGGFCSLASDASSAWREHDKMCREGREDPTCSK